jgi:hypothetical protein
MWLSDHLREALLTVGGLVSLLLLAPLARSEIDREQRMDAAPDTPATLVSVQIGVMDVPAAYVRVTAADGHPYEVRVTGAYFAPTTKEGDTVQVKVDPLDPTIVEFPGRHRVAPWLGYTIWIVLLGTGGWMIVAAVLGLVRSRRDPYR